jgi:hypothetical protein
MWERESSSVPSMSRATSWHSDDLYLNPRALLLLLLLLLLLPAPLLLRLSAAVLLKLAPSMLAGAEAAGPGSWGGQVCQRNGCVATLGADASVAGDTHVYVTYRMSPVMLRDS